MAFIDNLKDATQKAKETVRNSAANASEKTKNFVEVQKLTSQIHDEEKLIDAWKMQIGEIYYELGRSGRELTPDAMEYCGKIAMAYDRIGALEDEIRFYKGEKTPEPEPEPAPAPAPEGGIFCPECGVKAPAGAAFCSSCGRDLRGV